MNSIRFEQLLRETCEHVGIADWQSVVRGMSVLFDGCHVGLRYDECLPSTVAVCVDLGEPPEHGMAMYLLFDNAAEESGELAVHGYFAVHPDTGAVLYRHSFSLDEDVMRGPQLAAHIANVVAAAQARLQAAARSCREARHRIRQQLSLMPPETTA